MPKFIKILFFVSLLCFLTINTEAQHQNLKPLNIGDYVPAITFNHVVNYKTKTANFSDFREKFVILDFFATWCSPCVKALSEFEILQKNNNDRLQIIVVTDESKEVISSFLAKRKIITSLPFITSDSVLRSFFPHQSIPHEVWIDSNGVVRAITSSEEITEENILSFLVSGTINLPTKVDIDLEYPLYASKYLPEENLLSYSIFIKGKKAGLPYGYKIRKREGKQIGLAFTNMPIIEIYRILVEPNFPESRFPNNRIITEVKDSTNLFYLEKSSFTKDYWDIEHLFSYDIILPEEPELVRERALMDLNEMSGFIGKMEKKVLNCYILIRSFNNDALKTKGNQSSNSLKNRRNPGLTNSSINELVNRFNDFDFLEKPIVDESHIEYNIDVQFNGVDFSNLKNLKVALRSKGLDIIEAEREVEVLVIKDKATIKK